MEAEVKGQGLLWPISPICIPTPSPCPPISPICTNCRAVEAEVKLMLEAALAVARDCVTSNRPLHDALSAELRQEEKVEGAALQVR